MSAIPIVDVRRYWTTRDAELHLDAGYLSDPESEYAALLGPHPAVSLNTLDDVPCLVLLGEPNSGKTTALRSEVSRLKAAIGPANGDSAEVLLSVDLRDFADVADLRATVFEHPELIRWKSGTHRLTLALDSLDEALIEMRKLATRLAAELRELPTERLRLRIACRTADWPPVLERELGELWGESDIQVLEIAPLRRRDVLAIAAGHLGDARAGEFIEAVAAQDAEPFAAKPGTLKFLVSSFATSGRLPSSQVELYTIGCRALCEEANESRRAARRVGALSVDERMAIAARIAAAVVLGGHTAVWMGLDRDTPQTDMRLADLLGDERTPTGTVRVDEAVLRDEVLSCGLFSARGSERLGWAHQTYGEFLAAWWLTRRELTVEQVVTLLTVNDEIGRKLVPQLYETAAWVANLQPALFAAIANVEPSVLLRSDVASASEHSREQLVDALLASAVQNTLPAPEFGQRWRYGRLRHPALGKKLSEVIANGALPDRVRDLALDIAIACETPEVAAAAANLALDTSASIDLRAMAARAVASAGDQTESARLRQLATGSDEKDLDDDLKGAALDAVWRTIPPDELFPALSRTRRPNRSGAYSAFMGELAGALSDEYVAPGLLWIERLGHAGSPGERQLQTSIVTRAFDLLDDADVLARLVALAWRSLLQYQPLLDDAEERAAIQKALAVPSTRRRVLEGLVQTASAAAYVIHEAPGTNAAINHARSLVAIRSGLNAHALMDFGYVAVEDFAFVLDSLGAVTNGDALGHSYSPWGELAMEMFDISRLDHVIAVLDRVHIGPVLSTFGELTEPVEIGGPEAARARQRASEQKALREKWALMSERRERQTADRVVESKPLPSVERLSTALETPADPERHWINVFLELVRDEKGGALWGDYTGDVRASGVWRDAGQQQREAALDSAEAFIALAKAPELNLGDGIHLYRYAWAGYAALRLLAAEAPVKFERIDSAAWGRWAPTVALAEPYRDDAEEREEHAALVRRAYSATSTTFESAVLGAIDYALGSEHGSVPALAVSALAMTPIGESVRVRCLDQLERDLREGIMDSQGAPVVDEESIPLSDEQGPPKQDAESRARARQSRSVTLISLLVALLQGGNAEVRADLAGILDDPNVLASIDPESPEADRALIAAQALLLGASDAAWDVVSKPVRIAPSFAKALFLRSAVHREVPIKDFRERLGVRGVAELFVALTEAFPYETDPWHTGVYSPNARDNVAWWRRAMLDALEQWGNQGAVVELQRIQAALPQYDWLGFSVARARENEGRSSWRPVSPRDLFALADNRDRRLVRNADELLQLVVESLGRYQQALQGDLPAVADLWDYSTKNLPRPRDEGHFADHVARFLRKDLQNRGIAVGCELVVRRGGKPRASGLRTDIYVTAATSSRHGVERASGDIASLVIEAKGSWHDEVLTAMRTQLVQGYLREHAGTRHGIYLVGDFTCDAWMKCDARRQSEALGGIAALQHNLDVEAHELSRGGVRVTAVVVDTSLPST